MSTIVGAAAGLVLGVAFTAVAFRLCNRSDALPESEALELSFADRESVSAEFAAHTVSVRRELGRYADELADGDDRLREQLRQFEVRV
jgi:hypothetical protein